MAQTINKTATLNIECVKGNDLIFTTQITDEREEPISLGSYSFSGAVVNSYDDTVPIATFIFTYDSANKILNIELDNTVTSNINRNKYLYYINMVDNITGDKFTILRGELNII